MTAIVRSVALVLGGTIAGVVAAEEPRPPALEGVAFEQRLDAQVPLELTFVDERGETVVLRDLVGGRPTILNFVYYECPMLCTLVVNGLISSLRAVPLDIERDFRVVTISIDPKETPALAAAKKKNVMGELNLPVASEGWRFLTGDEASVRRLADSVGFEYRYEPETDQYAHASGLVVLTPAGRVSRYLFGIEYAPRDVRLALVEASSGKIGSLAEKLLLFCYEYDPATARYSVALLRIVRLGGVLTLGSLLTFVFLARRRELRRARGSAA